MLSVLTIVPLAGLLSHATESVAASYGLGPTPMDLALWPGALVMVLIATLTAALVTSSGRSACFVGALVLRVYLVFAMTLYLMPPRAQ